MSWLRRFRDAPMPYQEWRPFPPEAIVQVRSAYHPDVPDAIGLGKDFYWGFEEELGTVGEGVIFAARRLDKPKGEN